jgi:toluene monooxygenase system ferredoxin subunit
MGSFMRPVDAGWQVVATLDDVWEGDLKAVDVGGLPILLVNVGGKIRAYEDRCPHAGSRLSGGTLRGEILTCPTHEWAFDCRVGCGVNPDTSRLRSIPVRVRDEAILLRKGRTP